MKLEERGFCETSFVAKVDELIDFKNLYGWGAMSRFLRGCILHALRDSDFYVSHSGSREGKNAEAE